MRRIILQTLLVAAAFLLAAHSTIAAKIIYVDDDGLADFDTIQEAIDAAADGDTVLVAPGTYTGEGNRDIDFTRARPSPSAARTVHEPVSSIARVPKRTHIEASISKAKKAAVLSWRDSRSPVVNQGARMVAAASIAFTAARAYATASSWAMSRVPGEGSP